MQLGRIIIFPIKSLDGVALDEVQITSGGILENDRIYAIFDSAGKIVNGKRTPRVHALRCAFDAGIKEARLWQNGGSVPAQFPLDEPTAINKWLGDFFGFPVTLRRDLRKGFPDDNTAFGPTITSEASLRAVQEWFPELSLENVRRRFRANLEISGGPAFCEDSLYNSPAAVKPFQIGGVRFSGHNPCQRCVVPTRDPDSSEPVAEFQKKFMQLRREHLPEWADAGRFNHYYRFAVNTSIAPTEAGKRLRLGDVVKLEPG